MTESKNVSKRSILSACVNWTSAIQKLREKILGQFHHCPAFCDGDLQDALDDAFPSSSEEKRRPLLIYIHHDAQMTALLTDKGLIDFLQENYILWPWDITEEANRKAFVQLWEKNFPGRLLFDFSEEQCPMLIGVMRRLSIAEDASTSFQHEPTLILENDQLLRLDVQVPLNIDSLLQELQAFLEEFRINEQYLSPDFQEKTNLCWDVIEETARYLPLNDAITAFSMILLYRLHKSNIQLPVDQPSNEFIQIILRKLESKQIPSLRLEANRFKTTLQLASEKTFENVRALTIHHLEDKKQLDQFHRYFSNLLCLILSFDREYNLRQLCKLFSIIPSSTRRLEVRCPSIRCSHSDPRLLFIQASQVNETLQSFVLSIDHSAFSLVNRCTQGYQKCLLKTITDCIRIMRNVQRVRIVINRGHVETVLDVDEWLGLVGYCPRLEKIKLKILQSPSAYAQHQEEIIRIQSRLIEVRASVDFQVKVN